jgi:hypothetical protein
VKFLICVTTKHNNCGETSANLVIFCISRGLHDFMIFFIQVKLWSFQGKLNEETSKLIIDIWHKLTLKEKILAEKQPQKFLKIITDALKAPYSVSSLSGSFPDLL